MRESFAATRLNASKLANEEGENLPTALGVERVCPQIAAKSAQADAPASVFGELATFNLQLATVAG
jgi:hypothetical protein